VYNGTAGGLWNFSLPISSKVFQLTEAPRVQATLLLLATLAFPSDDIRRQIASPSSPSSPSSSNPSSQNPPGPQRSLLPTISIALRSKRHVGTRHAACQCVRAMSRAVSVLRTSIVDSGLGMEVLKVVMGGSNRSPSAGKTETGEIVDSGVGTSSAGWGRWGGVSERDEDRMDVGDGGVAENMDVGVEKSDEGKDGDGLGEDRRVLSAALAAVCNIVNDFSPLRPVSGFKIHSSFSPRTLGIPFYPLDFMFLIFVYSLFFIF